LKFGELANKWHRVFETQDGGCRHLRFFHYIVSYVRNVFYTNVWTFHQVEISPMVGKWQRRPNNALPVCLRTGILNFSSKVTHKNVCFVKKHAYIHQSTSFELSIKRDNRTISVICELDERTEIRHKYIVTKLWHFITSPWRLTDLNRIWCFRNLTELVMSSWFWIVKD